MSASSGLDQPTEGVWLSQPSDGFRYGSEAYWLAGLALEDTAPASALDLGTGSGILAWLLASQGVRSLGVELRPEWVTHWGRSLAASQVSAAASFVLGDVRDLSPMSVDLVVSNPPFFADGTGPRPQNLWRAAARFETVASLRDFAFAAGRSLCAGGQACFVVPRSREMELVTYFQEQARGEITCLRMGRRRSLVRWRPDAPASEHHEFVDDRGERVHSWYRRFGQPGPSQSQSAVAPVPQIQ